MTRPPSDPHAGLPVVDLDDAVEADEQRSPLLPRPVTGFVVLVLAAVVVVVLSGLNPAPVTGQAVTGPSLVLPAAGDCVSWATPTARRTLPVPEGVEVVDCAEVHQAEVVAAWRFGRTPSSSELEQQCREMVSGSSWSTVADGWGPVTARPRATFVRSGSGPLDWFACVRTAVTTGPRPWQLSLLGPLPAPGADAARLAVPSPTLRWCLDAGDRSVGCDRPHAAERIGVLVVAPGELRELDCRDYARSQVGAAFDEGLRADVRSGPQASFNATESWSGNAFFCDVRPPDGRQLSASVVGLGDAPLPLA